MTNNPTKRVLWAFAAEGALLSTILLLLDKLPPWILILGAVVAIGIPVVCYLRIFSEPKVYRAWFRAAQDVGLVILRGVRRFPDLLSLAHGRRLAQQIGKLKVFPSTSDDWLALVLFPFKAYVFAGLPFVWVSQKLMNLFSSNPGRSLRSAAAVEVSAGYAICLLVLLVGALLQSLFSERGRSTATLLVFLLGILMYVTLLRWGLTGR